MGPLTAVWTSLDEAGVGSTNADIEKIREKTELAIILTGKAFSDISHQRRHQLIDTFKKSTTKTKHFLNRSKIVASSKLFGRKFEQNLQKLTKHGSSSQAVVKALREVPDRPTPRPAPRPKWNDSWNRPQKAPIHQIHNQWSKRGNRGRGRGR